MSTERGKLNPRGLKPFRITKNGSPTTTPTRPPIVALVTIVAEYDKNRGKNCLSGVVLGGSAISPGLLGRSFSDSPEKGIGPLHPKSVRAVHGSPFTRCVAEIQPNNRKQKTQGEQRRELQQGLQSPLR
jgi:hypothetical protein